MSDSRCLWIRHSLSKLANGNNNELPIWQKYKYVHQVNDVLSKSLANHLLALCGFVEAVIDEDACQRIRIINTDNNNTYIWLTNADIQINTTINNIIHIAK